MAAGNKKTVHSWATDFMPSQLGIDVDPEELRLLGSFNEANPALFKFAARQLDTTVATLNKKKRFPVLLAEADVDPRTGGAAAVVTKSQRDTRGNIGDMTIQYWRMRPNGGQRLQDLINIETGPGKDENHTSITGMWVLGREIDVSDIAKVNRVLEAARRINTSLRAGTLPEVAKIFKDTYMHEVVSEKLPIIGLDEKGGFDFAPSIEGQSPEKVLDLEVPPSVALALDGRGVNTLDYRQITAVKRPVSAVDPDTAMQFISQVGIETDTKGHEVKASIEPGVVPEGVQGEAIDDLAQEHWSRVPGDDPTKKGKRNFRLDKLNILGEDLLNVDTVTRMRGLGILNRVMHSLRRRDYPEIMDYLTEFDQLDLVEPLPDPPALEEGGRMYMVSLLGNGRDEIVEDFGDQIGSTKIIVHEGKDKDGKIDRVAVGHDLGMFIPKEGSEWSGAVPDVVEWLKQVDHWFITHRHLDHAHGIAIYARKGLLEDKTFHATPDVIRAIEKSLNDYDVKRKDWPKFQAITKEGAIDIEKDGTKRMTVEWSPHATPHSARTTPFRYIGRFGNKILGSYLNPGDMRFGRYMEEGYDGPKPAATWIDQKFFSRGLRGLAEREPDLDPADVDRQDTVADFDVTSVKKRGWAVTEPEVEHNMNELLNGVFKDKGVLMAMISTNDNRYESALRIATHTGRNLMEVGSSVEQTATTNNVLGVNYHVVEPNPNGGNIQIYLDHVYDERLGELKEALEKEKAEGPARGRKAVVDNTLKAIDWITERRHHGMVREDHDYEKHGKDSFMKPLVGRPVHMLYDEMKEADEHLGALIAGMDGKVDERLPRFTATLRTSRTSKTAGRIMGDDPARRIIPVTGTQGSMAEMEAQLNKIAEGRSLFEADPKHRHTAVPISADTDVIIISQSSIPGNEKNQKALIDRLTRDRNYTVVVAMGDGFRAHNLKGDQAERLKTLYGKQKGVELLTETDGSLTVLNKGLHSSGHGNEKDVEAFANLIRPDIAQPQHVTDPESINRALGLFKKIGLNTKDRIVENFEALSINKGATPEQADAQSIGRMPASLVVFKLIRKFGKFFGGHLEAKRILSNERRGGERRDGLMAGENKEYEANFPVQDPERVREWQSRRPVKRPEPSRKDRSRPIPERRDRGPNLPPMPAPKMRRTG